MKKLPADPDVADLEAKGVWATCRGLVGGLGAMLDAVLLTYIPEYTMLWWKSVALGVLLLVYTLWQMLDANMAFNKAKKYRDESKVRDYPDDPDLPGGN